MREPNAEGEGVCVLHRTARAASIVASIMRRRLSSMRIDIDCKLARSADPSSTDSVGCGR